MSAVSRVCSSCVVMVVIVAIGMLAEPAVAAASGFDTATKPSNGPVLMDGRIAWPERIDAGGVRVRRARFTGDARTTVLTRPGTAAYRFRARLAGSRDWLAADIIASERHGGKDFVFHDLFTGASSGVLTERAEGCPFFATPLPSTIELSGRDLIHHSCEEPAVQITDLADESSVTAPGSDRGLRISGPYAAWVDGPYAEAHDAVVVYNLETGDISYTVPPAAAHPLVRDLDLRADGTVVVAYAGSPALGWASPTAPVLHKIPIGGRNYSIRVRGAYVAFERGGDSDGEVPRADVGVTDLDGHVTILGRGADASVFERELDFDGRRIAWYAYRCRGARMHIRSVGSKVMRDSLVRCPLRLRKRPTVRKGKYVVLKPRCYGYAGGRCQARDVRLTACVHDRWVRVAEGVKADHVPLTERGKRLLEERRSLDVRIVATMRDGAGTHERRHGKAVLKVE